MITLENYEEYMMMHADGELQPHEEVALQAFLNNNPSLKAEMALYESARLTPDHSLVYAQKESLMKPLAEKKVIALPRFRTYAIAAGVAALIVCTVFALRQGNEGTQDLPPVATTAPADHAKSTITNNPKEALAVNTPSTPANDTHSQIQAPKQEKTTNTLPNNNNTTGIAKAKETQNSYEGLATATRQQVIMNSMEVNDMKSLPTEKTPPAALALVAVPEYELPQIEAEEKGSWIDRLPLEERKKKNLANVAMAVANKCEQISEFKENITKKHVSLRVEHKNLIVSF